jgi:hypothetical protein
MSPLLIALAIVVMTWMLAQFGGRLAARNATIWWLFACFFAFSAIAPQLLRPIAELLSIESVSNLVLASMVVFLLYQTIELVAHHTDASRRLRRFVCRNAAQTFLREHPKNPPCDKTSVLVVLPCFNEEDCLPQTLAAVKAIQDPDLHIDWCVVDDGSSDDSPRILGRDAPLNHASHLANTGVAGVLLTGFHIGRGLDIDFVVQCDADGQHPIHHIPTLVHEAKERQVDLLIGSRYVPGSPLDASSTRLRRFGSQIIAITLRMFSPGLPVRDPTSGFRVYSRKAVAHLLRHMPDDYPEPESIALLAVTNAVIAEYPTPMQPRSGGQSSIAAFGAVQYMIKVISAMLGLRLRTLMRR